ncbi:ABZJ_00895 family protein [Pseudomonas sp. MAP12]|uniref:ABZJ_00895 family protein n=1 Tax=Geopseudomonas aromaticivorans TaxID=2849492 RepID=A0ABS6N2E6_9GAMM|nr:ABZJ_00895 family protein [Pseudomonas aromaticivorans]MBV2134839.1 ABZJ_00895 family protein [Pseudomonas aromaticivorans]
MSLVALLGRFALAYLFLLFGIAIGMHLIGLQSNSGTNTAALLGAVMWACLAFAKKNGRYLSSSEQRATFLGMLIVDLLLQSSIILLVSTTSPLSFGAVFYALAFVAGLHALVIWLMIGTAGKQYAKDATRTRKS